MMADLRHQSAESWMLGSTAGPLDSRISIQAILHDQDLMAKCVSLLLTVLDVLTPTHTHTIF